VKALGIFLVTADLVFFKGVVPGLYESRVIPDLFLSEASFSFRGHNSRLERVSWPASLRRLVRDLMG
jgi:hypothetical protein